MTPIVNPLPFAAWGVDILDPFPKAMGQRKYLFIAVHYFTKWIEAIPVASTTTLKYESSFAETSSPTSAFLAL